MLKVLVMILVMVFGVCGGSSGIKGKSVVVRGWKERVKYEEQRYEPILDSLDRIYEKQVRYSTRDGQDRFYWSYVPIAIFPFFCMGNRPGEMNEVVYVDSRVSMLSYVDNSGQEHMQVGVESHYGVHPMVRTYRMHFYLYNMMLNRWQEEDKAREVPMVMQSGDGGGAYGCK